MPSFCCMLCPCFLTISMLHVQVHAAWTWTSSTDLVMQDRRGHATWTCSVDIDMQHGHGHAAWKNTCCLSTFMFMLHDNVHVRAECPYLDPCCMSMSTLHVPVHAVCPCLCCMPMFSFAPMSMLHIHALQHGRGHANWTWVCSLDMGMKHGHRHAP